MKSILNEKIKGEDGLTYSGSNLSKRYHLNELTKLENKITT